MTVSRSAVLESIIGLSPDVLERWIALGWVTPASDTQPIQFDVTDVARVRLLYDLRYDLALGDDSLPVILSLVDQLYAVRRRLAQVLGAVDGQPDDIRARIVAVIEQAG